MEPIKVNVLDHGFVELIDIMGDDAEPARAARISYGNSGAREWGTPDKRGTDSNLISYLWENHHTTPFEMIELKWRAKMPIFVARQWVRHRTANINEFSMRYADPSKIAEEQGKIDYYYPEVWRRSDIANKQGSVVDTNISDDEVYSDAVETAISAYKLLQERGIANEMARMVLPVSVYTEWIWKNDLHNTLHFLKLRTDEHAQWEMRQYANAMLSIMQERLPNLMSIVWPKEVNNA